MTALRQPMHRVTRTWRGLGGAAVATLLAAASHALAGGPVTWLALIATAVLAAPLCVALAGRVASVWRLSLGVGVSQLLYHWSFAGLGAPSAPLSGGLSVSPHAAHAGWFAGALGTPGAQSSLSSDVTMWIAHAVAALLTIALMARGERAFLAIVQLIGRTVAWPRVAVAPGSTVSASRVRGVAPVRQLAPLFGVMAISHRGPPAAGHHTFA